MTNFKRYQARKAGYFEDITKKKMVILKILQKNKEHYNFNQCNSVYINYKT